MSKLEEYYDPQKDIEMNPVDYYNIYETWESAFNGFEVEFDAEKGEFLFEKKIVGILENGMMLCKEKFLLERKKTKQIFTPNKYYTKFMIYTLLKHKNNFHAAATTILTKKLGANIPYIRVAINYYKILYKPNKYGILNKILKLWRKSDITDDHGPAIFNKIPKFDDFIVRPDNVNYSSIVNGFYNLYSEFPHKAVDFEVSEDMIPVSLQVLRHIFGEQYNQGLKYMKILYEMPWERTYVLCLVSTEGGTGKTTFLKWLNYIFGANFSLLDIQTLEGDFNGSYKDKNIIGIDESVSEKTRVVDKVKNLTTSDSILCNEKNINHYTLEFYGKIIFCSNKETDFIKVEQQEERFWVRKIPKVPAKYKNNDIISDLIKEIPMFLKYLEQQPEIIRETRFVMTYEEIKNESIDALKKESKNWLYKELMEFIAGYFETSEHSEFMARPQDIKERFFKTNNNAQIAYIRKVLNNDFNKKTIEQCRFYPFNNMNDSSVNGTPYLFKRSEFTDMGSEFDSVIDDTQQPEIKQQDIPF